MKSFKLPSKKGHNPAPRVHRPKMSALGRSAFPQGQQAFNTPDSMVQQGQAFDTGPATPDVAGMPPEAAAGAAPAAGPAGPMGQ
jgi:hypothetical protein